MFTAITQIDATNGPLEDVSDELPNDQWLWSSYLGEVIDIQ